MSFVAFANTTRSDRAIVSKLFLKEKKKGNQHCMFMIKKIKRREEIKAVGYPTQKNSNKIRSSIIISSL